MESLPVPLCSPRVLVMSVGDLRIKIVAPRRESWRKHLEKSGLQVRGFAYSQFYI